MNTQQTIKAIVDTAVNDDYAAAEKEINQLIQSSYIGGYEDGVDAAKLILSGEKALTPQQSFDKRYKKPKQ